MDSSFSEGKGVKSIALKGLNERVVPESISIGDLSKLIGLRQSKIGELIRYPGELRTLLPPFSSIRGLFYIGEYLIIQTEVTLLRLKMNEVFPEFTQVIPELFPDNYAPPGPTPPSINPELMSYALLNYELTSGTNGAATVASTWNSVPLNVEESDSDNRVSIAAGVITITAGAYPAFVRIDGEVCIKSPDNIGTSANCSQRCQLRLRNNTTSAIVANGINFRELTANAINEPRQILHPTIKGRFQIAAPTDFRLELFCTESTTFGTALSTGQPEIYAQLEILIEE